MNNDIRANGWVIKKVTEVNDAEELMNIFQTFYSLNGRLPLSNGLLVVPDTNTTPGENKVNMKQLYELFKNKIPVWCLCLFLVLFNIIWRKTDHLLIKNATKELYANLPYGTLSRATDFRFEAVSDLTSKVSFLLQKDTLKYLKQKKIL